MSLHLGNGRQVHLALTTSEAKYLAITGNVAFVPPLNPPLQPEQAVGATGPQITEAIRMHLELKQTFNTYQAVNQAFASMFSPAISTWCAAIDASHFTSWPELTSAQVRQYPPQSIAMVKGHLDQERANARSTNRQPRSMKLQLLILSRIQRLIH